MNFATIHSPADPEDYCWEVELGEEQELRWVDDQHAEVIYTDGEHVAVTITATEAHDAEGSAVPTSIAVSGGNVITLTVHHRAGNPAAGGAAFDYPITQGVGWEGGFHTYEIQMPPAAVVVQAPASCVVPGLLGRKLKENRLRLRTAGCKLGKVRGERRRGARVVKQSREAGSVLAAGARVAVKLG
jgi:hypothetical protein